MAKKYAKIEEEKIKTGAKKEKKIKKKKKRQKIGKKQKNGNEKFETEKF